ncbi:hypothetical protein [Chromohalobacter sp. 48-RD10]|uniref:hypothetical protein n=1 Tax=Chromohalobacter sp. 48-RD10 TaxID=2994063 RepID=UPI0024691353|nr:hypothetical protein [Chromohalobacter sp. 48-RD10]
MAKHRTTEQQLADAEAKLARLRELKRKEDTRRRILIGSMILGRAEGDDATMERLLKELDGWLGDGHRDRKLFGLGPISGLYGATLRPAAQQPGWALNMALKPVRDRYGNPVGA